MAKKYGDWEIVRTLDEGGQAHIFLVKNTKDGQTAVLKRLKNINRLDRFKFEFKVMQDHDGQFFPKIYDADLDSERPYFVMEHFEKGCLSVGLVKTWSLEDKIHFYIYLITAVAYANDQGVIHRDLKPENILVSDDRLPRVTDFGICYINDHGERQTLVDEAVGSFRFMAPEMEDGRANRIGQQTDIYALGKIAYWLFTGKIYNRERHRDPEFNITMEGRESWRHYLNDYLDKVTNHDPDERPEHTADLAKEFSFVRHAIQQDIRYLDLQIEQRCSFCGFGTYRIEVNALDPSDALQIEGFGFVPRPRAQWLVMSCDRCGNIQTFRKDLCKQWSWKRV